MTEIDDSPGVRRLVSALLTCTGAMSQLLDHMARSPTAPDVEAVVAQAKLLLTGALAPLEAQLGRAELRTAARAVEAATTALVSEILLVPHPPPESCEGRRHRG
jgi:hypothetical protein